MNIQLDPGFSGYVFVEDLAGVELFRKKVTSARQVKEFVNAYGQSIPGSNWLKSTFLPTRTDNVRDFCKDLFFPTFVNRALQIDRFVLKIFASLFALALDIGTLIPRLCLSPIKILIDKKQKRVCHPLEKLIQHHPASKQALKNGILKIKVSFENIDISDRNCPHPLDANKILYYKIADKSTCEGHAYVTIKCLPRNRTTSESTRETTQYYRYSPIDAWQQQHSTRVSTNLLANIL